MNRYFNVGDELQYVKCADCDDVIWTEHENHGIACLCGAWWLRGNTQLQSGRAAAITTDELQAIYDEQTWPIPSQQT